MLPVSASERRPAADHSNNHLWSRVSRLPLCVRANCCSCCLCCYCSFDDLYPAIETVIATCCVEGFRCGIVGCSLPLGIDALAPRVPSPGFEVSGVWVQSYQGKDFGHHCRCDVCYGSECEVYGAEDSDARRRQSWTYPTEASVPIRTFNFDFRNRISTFKLCEDNLHTASTNCTDDIYLINIRNKAGSVFKFRPGFHHLVHLVPLGSQEAKCPSPNTARLCTL